MVQCRCVVLRSATHVLPGHDTLQGGGRPSTVGLRLQRSLTTAPFSAAGVPPPGD